MPDRVGGVVSGLQVVVLCDVAHALLGLWPPHPTVSLLNRLWCKVGHRLEIFVTILILYFVVGTVLTGFMHSLERRAGRGLAHGGHRL